MKNEELDRLQAKAKRKLTYIKGERVLFVRGTKKYACRGGIVKKKIALYTDDTFKYRDKWGYPTIDESSAFAHNINIYREDPGGCRKFWGYVVDAINSIGKHVETVAITEDFIAGSFD
tara:strand:+ start:593 stop:946 length:354 start_codon:yes stop_codon:yes gene_type:complete